nr:hypothetical protein [Tanacetum cinerariifolium]
MENKPNVAGSGPAWLFDIDSLSQTMNYHPVLAENQSNPTAGFQDTERAGEEGTHTYVLFSVLSDGSTNPKNSKDAYTAREQGDKAMNKDKGKNLVVTITGFRDLNKEFAECINNSSNGVSAVGPSVSAAGLDFTNNTNDFTAAGPLVSAAELNFINNTNNFSADGPSNAAMPNLEDFSHNADDVGAEADTNNMKSIISVSPIPTTRIHKDHPTFQIIGDLSSTAQTRKEPKKIHQALKDPSWIEAMQEELLQFKMQKEPKRVNQALKDPSWIEAMQEELLQFKMQKVWILVDLPYGKRAIGTKWVYRNKKDKIGIVIRNKARLITQGHTQEEGIDYEE